MYEIYLLITSYNSFCICIPLSSSRTIDLILIINGATFNKKYVFLFFSEPIRPFGVVLISPFALMGIFYLTVTEVKFTDGILKYRRFLRWREIPLEEIKECRVSWIPSVGCIRLNHFIPPWGKIYFVHPGAFFQIAWSGGQTKFTAFVNAARKGKQVEIPREETEVGRDGRRWLGLCAASAAVGIVYSVFYYSLFPRSPLDRNWAGFPRLIVALVKLEGLALAWPWGLLTCGLLILAILRLRHRPESWILAFVLGALLSSLAIKPFL